MNTTTSPKPSEKIARRFQSYRGTWAWLIQRISAIGLFLLIPMKIYTGWAARDKVPYPEFLLSAKKMHFLSKVSERLDIALLLFFLLHGFYGLRVILIDLGVIREDRWFWRTMTVALTLFGTALWFVYIREHE
jgi:succinate dehydrogenase/fumarate reductase cytochrome b subunit